MTVLSPATGVKVRSSGQKFETSQAVKVGIGGSLERSKALQVLIKFTGDSLQQEISQVTYYWYLNKTSSYKAERSTKNIIANK